MRKISKLISLTLILVVLIISFNKNSVSAASASLSASSTQVTVGTTVTLTATITAGAWNVTISGNGVNQKAASQTDTTSNKTVTVTATFTPQSAGTYTFNLSGDITDYSEDNARPITDSVTITATEPAPEPEPTPEPTPDPTPEPEPTPGPVYEPEPNYPSETTPSQTVQEEPKSSNNYLSGITLSVGTLSPEFYRETFDYTIEFDDTVDLYELSEIEINATSEDDRATVSGTGTIQLNEGENNITLTVTAENGSARNYNVKLTKPEAIEQSSLRLKTLVINGITSEGVFQTVNFEFDPETFEYNITVPNNITGLSINPTTENEDILIEQIGNENLNVGDNRVLIILTSPSDDSVKTTYTINVERQAAITEEAQQGLSREQLGIIIITSVIGLILLIVIIIAIVKHHRRKNGFEYDDEDNDVDYLANNNEEDVENPYPDKIFTRDQENDGTKETEDIYKENNVKSEDINEEEKNYKEDSDEIKLKTTYEEDNTELENYDKKSKWDEFINDYDDTEDDSPKKKKKHGKRFLN